MEVEVPDSKGSIHVGEMEKLQALLDGERQRNYQLEEELDLLAEDNQRELGLHYF